MRSDLIKETQSNLIKFANVNVTASLKTTGRFSCLPVIWNAVGKSFNFFVDLAFSSLSLNDRTRLHQIAWRHRIPTSDPITSHTIRKQSLMGRIFITRSPIFNAAEQNLSSESLMHVSNQAGTTCDSKKSANAHTLTHKST